MKHHPALPPIGRRTALGLLAGSLATSVWAQGAPPVVAQANRLAIGNYGMKTLTLEEALHAIAAIGFDGFELCAIPEWDSTPTRLGVERRKSVGDLLKETGLPLVAVMENIPPSADEKLHLAGLERLKAALVLGRDLVPDQKPMVQTVLGGGKWDEVQSMLRDRVGEWAQLAGELDATVCIKPHRFGAMSTPAHAAWLIEQLGHPERLRMVYDYSHYALRPESEAGELTIAQTIEASRRIVHYVAMKDTLLVGEKISFALPGEAGMIDHAAILKGLVATGYVGAFCCEVSSQVSSQPGYDPLVAARRCHEKMDVIWKNAGFPRRSGPR